MVEGGHEFASRIQEQYGICAADLRRKGKSALPTAVGGEPTAELEEEWVERQDEGVPTIMSAEVTDLTL
ncbi:hypothetical protein CYMTET_12321 [Cymbomonas tetramitiformis]|nr:hypothetical protein CYMTET_40571 [Cymbomonas tetramitiformis]KAK3279817.1 hypothetical protein CYMTET_12321 [Cymbomonas tetramitiformis]